MFAAVVDGDFLRKDSQKLILEYDQILKENMSKYQSKGFTNILMSDDLAKGTASLIQTSGLGGLKHNSVLISWPEAWKSSSRKVILVSQNLFISSASPSDVTFVWIFSRSLG